MIDFGILALFIVQLAIAFLTFFAWTRVKAEISRLEVLQQGITGVTAQFDALRRDFEALGKRQTDVEENPKALIRRFSEVEANLGKADRLLEKLEGKVASLGGRMSAIVKGRKGRDDDEETDPAPEGESNGTLFQPPGSHNEERPASSAIPRGFGKVARRAA